MNLGRSVNRYFMRPQKGEFQARVSFAASVVLRRCCGNSICQVSVKISPTVFSYFWSSWKKMSAFFPYCVPSALGMLAELSGGPSGSASPLPLSVVSATGDPLPRRSALWPRRVSEYLSGQSPGSVLTPPPQSRQRPAPPPCTQSWPRWDSACG